MSTVDIVDWNAISQQLDQLLELSPAQRQQRLQRLRGADPEMAAVLERLLAHETQAGQFLATPCWTPPCQVDGVGTRLGHYRLLRVLGEGGAGQVWLAERTDGRAPHQVALKRLHADLADAGARQRFERECDILVRLQHPNLAQLLDAGVAEDGRPYLALSYIQGEPITGYCQHQQLSVTARLQLFMQLCAAVSHAHVNRVVHRDLKPANILVTAAGQVCVLDFGIAQLLGADAEPGGDGFTVHYAAPEQIDGAAITAQADVYSLGVVLHELLVGQKPYHLRRRRDLEDGVRLPLPTPPKPSLAVLHHAQAGRLDPATARRLAWRLRGDVDSIVGKALCQAPEQRYASAEAMAQDLQRHLLHRPVQARPASFGYWLHGYLQRQRWGLALVILVLSGVSMMAPWWAPLSLSRPQALHGFVIARFKAAGQASPPAPDIRPSRAAGERWEHRTLTVRLLLQAGNDGQRS